MLGNIYHQVFNMKILKVIFLINVNILKQFLGTGIEPLVGNYDSIIDLVVSNDLVELSNILCGYLSQNSHKINQQFLVLVFMIKNKQHSIVLSKLLVFFLEILLGKLQKILRYEIASVLNHLQDCLEGHEGLLEFICLHYKINILY